VLARRAVQKALLSPAQITSRQQIVTETVTETVAEMATVTRMVTVMVTEGGRTHLTASCTPLRAESVNDGARSRQIRAGRSPTGPTNPPLPSGVTSYRLLQSFSVGDKPSSALRRSSATSRYSYRRFRRSCAGCANESKARRHHFADSCSHALARKGCRLNPAFAISTSSSNPLFSIRTLQEVLPLVCAESWAARIRAELSSTVANHGAGP
jgi:hypothetical protein